MKKMTNKEIAKEMGISVSTLYRALKASKAADEQRARTKASFAREGDEEEFQRSCTTIAKENHARAGRSRSIWR
jgi:predicted transcriptional regulator